MSERKMSAKGFFSKVDRASARSAAAGFIAQHREYMLTGEVAAHTAPIIAKIDKGELMPTPAIDEIRQAVFSHLMLENAAKLQKALSTAQQDDRSSGEVSTKPRREDKPYLATIYNEKGDIVEEIPEGKDKPVKLQKSCDTYQEAQGWIDRRLFDRPNTAGEIATLRETDKDGLPRLYAIGRDEAIGRILKRPKGPAMKLSGSARMSF